VGDGGMKFIYVDESGDQGQGDVFVMVGLLIDAYRLRKYTATFDQMIAAFLTKHPSAPKELKTKAFINGDGGWSKVDAAERKKFLSDVCALAAECAKVFSVAFSFDEFEKAANAGHKQTFGKNYWIGAAMYIAALVQQKMQGEDKNKGLTVLICDDNKQEMSKLSAALYEADPWFDPIYQTTVTKNGKSVWKEVSDAERFDHIINSAFAIKSQHSSLIQVADAVCYVYRRHIELKSAKESWEGEQKYFAELVATLESKRERLGRKRTGLCIEFYEAACHVEWAL
jgi:hypothetical protein